MIDYAKLIELTKMLSFSKMKFLPITSTFISFAIVAGCSAPPKNISCINEKGVTEWSDGSIQNQTSSLGTETFTWFKNDSLVEVSVMQDGNMEKIKVPATLNGTDLVFSATKGSSYIINTINGKINSTTTGDNIEDGKYVMKTEGTCNGFQ